MLVIGYRGAVDWAKVKAAFKRCTAMSQTDIDRVVKVIKSGQTISLANDFVLNDELRDLGILISN
jgi:hypothetical protein